MPHERVRFPGSQGVELVGRLESPEGEPLAYALFAHCFTCSKDLRSAGILGHHLVARGIAVLRFDFTGVGESGGDFADTNFSSNIGDLLAAAEYLRRARRAPALLVGHSLGGTAMLAAAARIPEAVAVATLGAPSDTSGLRATLAARLGDSADEVVEVDLGGAKRVRVRRQLLDDLAAEPLAGVVGNLDKALLIFHSPADRTVPIENAERLFLAARHPKSFVSLGTADHLLSDPRDAAQAGAVLAAWVGRYLDRAAATDEAAAVASAAPSPELSAGEVEVTGVEGSLGQEIRAGRHHLTVDEPTAQGGADAGPTPYALLLAALGSCTAITMRLYADRKRLPLTGTRVVLRASKIHAEDCVTCAESATAIAKLDRIDLAIELQGPLDEAQRARLLTIAGHCPVHRTLEPAVDIVTRLV